MEIAEDCLNLVEAWKQWEVHFRFLVDYQTGTLESDHKVQWDRAVDSMAELVVAGRDFVDNGVADCDLFSLKIRLRGFDRKWVLFTDSLGNHGEDLLYSLTQLDEAILKLVVTIQECGLVSTDRLRFADMEGFELGERLEFWEIRARVFQSNMESCRDCHVIADTFDEIVVTSRSLLKMNPVCGGSYAVGIRSICFDRVWNGFTSKQVSLIGLKDTLAKLMCAVHKMKNRACRMLNTRRIRGVAVDGLVPNMPRLDREKLLQEMIEILQDNDILVISSPPATGKTSLLQLFYEKFQDKCRYVSFFSRQDSLSAYDLIERLLVSPKDGMIILIDDAHERYDETGFWGDLLKQPANFRSETRIRYIISATYKLEASISSPVQFQHCRRIERDKLVITHRESEQVILWNLPEKWRSFKILVEAIVSDTAGHIGAAVAVIDVMVQHFPSPSEVSCEELLKFYTSKDLVGDLNRCFGNFALLAESNALRSTLRRALFSNVPINDPSITLYSPADQSLLSRMKRFGILTDMTNHFFTSPLARRFVLNWLYPDRPTEHPSSIADLVSRAIGSLSSSRLRASVAPQAHPSESTFQGHFLNAFLETVPADCRVVPELSRWTRSDKGTEDLKIDGYIDFYINGALRWGIELLVDGDRLGEHMARFARGGRYAPLQVSDYAIIDLRQGPVRSVRRHEKRITVFYDGNHFEYCDVILGLHSPCVRINLRN